VPSLWARQALALGGSHGRQFFANGATGRPRRLACPAAPCPLHRGSRLGGAGQPATCGSNASTTCASASSSSAPDLSAPASEPWGRPPSPVAPVAARSGAAIEAHWPAVPRLQRWRQAPELRRFWLPLVGQGNPRHDLLFPAMTQRLIGTAAPTTDVARSGAWSALLFQGLKARTGSRLQCGLEDGRHSQARSGGLPGLSEARRGEGGSCRRPHPLQPSGLPLGAGEL